MTRKSRVIKTQKLRRKITSISSARWATYATAGAASALACAPSAEAEIHYSGPVKHAFPGISSGVSSALFPLNSGTNLLFKKFIENIGNNSIGSARLQILPPNGQPGVSVGSIAGNFVQYGGFYVSNLGSRVNVSRLDFGAYCRVTSSGSELHCFGGTIGYFGKTGGHFQSPGKGFIAFTFDTGAGPQYGWARIRTDGDPTYRFILLDYAWADPGEKIQTGQKRSSRQTTAVPIKGSLGLLAMGGVGLLSWRRQRAQAAAKP